MNEVTEGILIAAAILTGLGVIGRSLWWLWKKLLRPLAQLVDDWVGEPKREGISPGRPGVLARLTSIEGVVAELSELKAVLAVVPRMEQRLTALEERLLAERDAPRVEAGGVGFQAELATTDGPSAQAVRSFGVGR